MIETRDVLMGDKTFRLSINDENLIEVYADAVAEQMVGIPVTKILFYATTGIKENTLGGKAVCRLTMPTAALLDFARQLLKYTDGAEKELKDSLAAHEGIVLGAARNQGKTD
jgi:hypothetical protein